MSTLAAEAAKSADFGSAICGRPIQLSQYYSSNGDRFFVRRIYIDLLEKFLEKFKEEASKAMLGWSVLESTNVKSRRVEQHVADLHR